jgi:hypothetical protein
MASGPPDVGLRSLSRSVGRRWAQMPLRVARTLIAPRARGLGSTPRRGRLPVVTRRPMTGVRRPGVIGDGVGVRSLPPRPGWPLAHLRHAALADLGSSDSARDQTPALVRARANAAPLQTHTAPGDDRRARWSRVVATRGLDKATPLPQWTRPLARALVPRGPLPQMTTGPGTRRALTAANASGAATPGTVHLPHAPRATPAGLETLAHELSHAADRAPGRAPTPSTATSRPAFFEGSVTDPGESRARLIGRTVGSTARSLGPARPGLGARVAQRLVDERAPIDAGERGRAQDHGATRSDAAQAPRHHEQASSRPRMDEARPTPAMPRRAAATPARAPMRTARAPLSTGRSPDRPSTAGERAARPPAAPREVRAALSTGPPRVVVQRMSLGSLPSMPDVSSLPVGGIRQAAGAAEQRARSAMEEAGGSAAEALQSGENELRSRAEGLLESGSEAIDEASSAATGAVESATSAVQSAGSGLAGLLGSAAGAATDSASQLGHLLEALEERILAEIERRGGRFAGAF